MIVVLFVPLGLLVLATPSMCSTSSEYMSTGPFGQIDLTDNCLLGTLRKRTP